MNTGSIFGGRPSLGAWVSYGLGTENQNLPAFVVIKDSEATVVNGVRNWGSGFMPAVYQGVEFNSDGAPIKYLDNPKGVDRQRQRDKLDLLGALNREFNATRASNTELDARIRSYELAYHMQAEAPDAVDLSKETEATKKLYGMDDKETATFGRNCLLARRLVEHGVRFVQLYSGAGSKWDSHAKIEANHTRLCRVRGQADRRAAHRSEGARPARRNARHLGRRIRPHADEREGRRPRSQSHRLHHVDGRRRRERRPDLSAPPTTSACYAVEDRLHVHDLHATILHLLGIDHTRLIYNHKGRPERIDQNEGHPYTKLLGAAAA